MLKNLADILFSDVCLLCKRACLSNEAFCSICELSIKFPKSGVDAPNSLFLYDGAIKDAIKQIKFQPDLIAAKRLALFSKKVFQDKIHILPPTISHVTFVPLHWRRRLWRGFDFSALIAKHFSSVLGIPLISTLQHQRFDKPLTLLGSAADRFSHVQGRYKAHRHVKARHVLLVDDVVTTGATLREANKVLCESGLHVTNLALAQTSMASGV